MASSSIVGRRGCLRLESDAIDAIKKGKIAAGDVMVLICCGPKGAGMQEIYQITAALKALPHCQHVALLTDGDSAASRPARASAIFRRKRSRVGPLVNSAMVT